MNLLSNPIKPCSSVSCRFLFVAVVVFFVTGDFLFSGLEETIYFSVSTLGCMLSFLYWANNQRWFKISLKLNATFYDRYASLRLDVNRDDSLPNETARHKSVRFRRIRHLMVTLNVRLRRFGGLGRTRYDSLGNGVTRHKSVRIGRMRHVMVKLHVRLVQP